jgi:hypothetical protein
MPFNFPDLPTRAPAGAMLLRQILANGYAVSRGTCARLVALVDRGLDGLIKLEAL